MRIVEYRFPMALDVGTTTLGGSQRWELYRVLSEPARLRLLALAAEEELGIGELAELLGESQPNVSRHAATLKGLGLLTVRREGTRAFVRVSGTALADAVVGDALESGRALVRADGSLARVAGVVREREASAREFFARPRERERVDGLDDTVLAYVATLSTLLPARGLAVDAGTGDGGLLDVLAPSFDRVVAIDRSPAQLEAARARVAQRGFRNVELLAGELGDPAVSERLAGKADVVFAARILHHAPRPGDLVRRLAELCKPAGDDGPGGALLVLDYAAHDDEAMRDEADVWLGFEPHELLGFARAAGLEGARVSPVPPALRGRGTDAHLAWQVLVARRGAEAAHRGRPRHQEEPSAPAALSDTKTKKGPRARKH